MEGANDRSKYMCFMISGDRIAFDSRRCDIIFPIKSVQTASSSKADPYLHEGKKKELSRERERERETEREREREREFAKLVSFWLVHFRYIKKSVPVLVVGSRTIYVRGYILQSDPAAASTSLEGIYCIRSCNNFCLINIVV